MRTSGSTFHLALDVGHFDVISGPGSGSIWGKPISAESHEKVALWVEGLRGTGPEGYLSINLVGYKCPHEHRNVLKEQKAAREAENCLSEAPAAPMKQAQLDVRRVDKAQNPRVITRSTEALDVNLKPEAKKKGCESAKMSYLRSWKVRIQYQLVQNISHINTALTKAKRLILYSCRPHFGLAMLVSP